MIISKNDVEHVAKLARLEVSEEEKEELTGQLNNILDYVSKMNKIDTNNIKPTSHVLHLKNVFREDVAKENLNREKVFLNAPEHDGEHFIVPQVIES